MLADDLVLALAMWTLANSHQVNIYTEEGKKDSANLLNYIFFLGSQWFRTSCGYEKLPNLHQVDIYSEIIHIIYIYIYINCSRLLSRTID